MSYLSFLNKKVILFICLILFSFEYVNANSQLTLQYHNLPIIEIRGADDEPQEEAQIETKNKSIKELQKKTKDLETKDLETNVISSDVKVTTENMLLDMPEILPAQIIKNKQQKELANTNIKQQEKLAQEKYGPIKSTDTLWSIAKQVNPDTNFSIYQTILALYYENKDVGFKDENINFLRPDSFLTVPYKTKIKSYDKNTAKKEFENLTKGIKPKKKSIKKPKKNPIKKQEQIKKASIKNTTANKSSTLKEKSISQEKLQKEKEIIKKNYQSSLEIQKANSAETLKVLENEIANLQGLLSIEKKNKIKDHSTIEALKKQLKKVEEQIKNEEQLQNKITELVAKQKHIIDVKTKKSKLLIIALFIMLLVLASFVLFLLRKIKQIKTDNENKLNLEKITTSKKTKHDDQESVIQASNEIKSDDENKKDLLNQDENQNKEDVSIDLSSDLDNALAMDENESIEIDKILDESKLASNPFEKKEKQDISSELGEEKDLEDIDSLLNELEINNDIQEENQNAKESQDNDLNKEEESLEKEQEKIDELELNSDSNNYTKLQEPDETDVNLEEEIDKNLATNPIDENLQNQEPKTQADEIDPYDMEENLGFGDFLESRNSDNEDDIKASQLKEKKDLKENTNNENIKTNSKTDIQEEATRENSKQNEEDKNSSQKKEDKVNELILEKENKTNDEQKIFDSIVDEKNKDLKSQENPSDMIEINEEKGRSAKLDLARAYLEMDDKKSAIATLEGIIKNGEEKDKSEAQKILDSLI